MISIVICSIDDARFRSVAANYASLLPAGQYELIRISDAKSLCEGYNRGFRQSRGEILIFCHDDIEILNADFHQRLTRHMQHFDLIGVVGATRLISGHWAAAGPPYLYGQIAQPGRSPGLFAVHIFAAPGRAVAGIQAVDGLFMAARRPLVQQLAFDQESFDGFHCYDADFSFRACLAGFRLGVACDINLFHASPGSIDGSLPRYMEIFQKKFSGRLCPGQRRHFIACETPARTKAEIVEIMTPPHWPPQEP